MGAKRATPTRVASTAAGNRGLRTTPATNPAATSQSNGWGAVLFQFSQTALARALMECHSRGATVTAAQPRGPRTAGGRRGARRPLVRAAPARVRTKGQGFCGAAVEAS